MPPFLPLPASTPLPRRAWIFPAAKLLALFLLILGAKFCVIRLCSTPLPFFDQWDGEGGNLLRPWLHGRLHWADLFAFHVQHRIALTRLLVLGLFQANDGQWDTQVEMIAAAVLHAGCAVALGAVLLRRLGPAAGDKLLLALALLFGLPFDWENTLSGGFQSQFYFLLGLSILAIWGLGCHRPGSAPWWTGVGAAVLSWVSMASAPLTPLAVAGGVALRRGRSHGGSPDPADARADGITLGAALALFALGLCTNIGVNPVTHLHPNSAGDFLGKFLGLLGWPNPTPWAAPLAYGPWTFLLARRLLRPRRAAGAADEFLLPLGLFAVLQTAAIAFARNQYHGLMVSRYMDILSIGAFVNFACLIQFAGEARPARGRAWLGALGAGWIALFLLGLASRTVMDVEHNLPFMRTHNAAEDANVAAFIAHPDFALLKGKDAFDFECDKPELLMDLLKDPLMREAWPTRARTPLALGPAVATGNVHPLTDGTPASRAMNTPPAGWLLERPAAGQRMTAFRSQTISHCLSWLLFSVRGEIGPGVRLGLVGERTGRTSWVLPPEDVAKGQWWSARVPAPPEPFHVEAVVLADADGGVEFLCPREMGRLSAWVDPWLDNAYGLVFAGVALWLAAAFAGGLAKTPAIANARGRDQPFIPMPEIPRYALEPAAQA